MLYTTPIKDVYRPKKPLNGDFYGIEIEVELLGFQKIEGLKHFSLKEDGSLRNYGLEFVSRPFGYAETKDIMAEVSMVKGIVSPKLVESSRTSTHIHMNVCDLTLAQVWNIMTTWYILEPLLLDFSGKYRKGNTFARSLLCSNALSLHLGQTIKRDHRLTPSVDLKYQGCNFSSLGSFGTLEFRTMRSTLDTGLLAHWLGILHQIKKFAIKFKNPLEILDIFSSVSNEYFIKRVLETYLIPTSLGLDRDINQSAEIITSIVEMHPDNWDFSLDPRWYFKDNPQVVLSKDRKDVEYHVDAHKNMDLIQQEQEIGEDEAFDEEDEEIPVGPPRRDNPLGNNLNWANLLAAPIMDQPVVAPDPRGLQVADDIIQQDFQAANLGQRWIFHPQNLQVMRNEAAGNRLRQVHIADIPPQPQEDRR